MNLQKLFILISLTFQLSAVGQNNQNTGIKMCFFNLDSLNMQCLMFTEIDQEIQKVSKEAEKKIQTKQKEIDEWSEKWGALGNLLSSEQVIYEQEAVAIQNAAMEFEIKVQEELLMKQEVLMNIYARFLAYYTKQYAKNNGFDAVIAYQFGQNIWYYNAKFDCTNELVKIMNEDYKKGLRPYE